MTVSDNIRGALIMAGAMCAYTFNDAFMKALSDEIPLFQAILFRGMGAIVFLTLMCRMLGQLKFNLGRRDWGLVILRSAGEVGGTFFFLTALFNMPIANVSAILQALPLSVSLAAAVILREPLGWRRLTAIAIGFAGVLLIIQPGGADFSAYSLYALGAVACVTLRDIAVRRMSRDVPSVFVALVAAVGVTGLGAVGAMFTPWAAFSTTSALQLSGATLCLIFGYIASVNAMRFGEIAFVAPFRYSSLLVALVLGVVIFDEWPNALALVGAGVVVATGLFTLYRETRLRRTPRMIPDRIR
ncbi:DMT family transporter [Yoonia litorea]|uniref:Permease of the drug/metabolite transporter (DMT) superfamily n=1 Tax=Yoonia litorea TaxID=1123755 RepID=A0A1I6N2H6_9RHOB|nr:DMT family transporter [Yoonia litorea]SFS22104.1 Permease of the drug/metabolite transporter (DMT) superfamily [Yoonia litorea]